MGLGATYSPGIVDNALDIARRIDHGWVIRSLAGELSIARDFEREALAVGDVPIQDAELGTSMISLMLFGWHVMMRTYFHPRHRVQRAFDV